MQFGFMKGCGTTNAIFLTQLQEINIYVAKRKICTLHFAFVDLEKLFIVCLGRLHGGPCGN